MNTVELLDAVKRRNAITSDYAAAKLLGISQAQVSRYRNCRDAMGEDLTIRAAVLAGLDPAVVLVDLRQERAVDDTARAIWASIGERLRSAAAAAVVAGVGIGGGPDAMAGAHTQGGKNNPPVYVMSNRLRAALRRLIATASRILTIDAGMIAA